MKTLVQMRNSPLKKLNKKRKVDVNSLLITSPTKLLKKTSSCRMKRNAESMVKSFSRKKESSKGQLRACSKKKRKKLELVQVVQSLPSTSKDAGLQTGKLKRQRRRKKKSTQLVLDETTQFQRRVRYLLIKLKLEQNLIDAYSGEGWKGQRELLKKMKNEMKSREKIKPERELQRAKKQILKCKLGLRDIIQRLDLLGSVGQIDRSLVASDGSIHHEHIICKKCKSREVQEDNDIILCDGTCNCAFHQKCHDPPLATEDIPPDDEAWLCKYCDCKTEILETINAHLGTLFAADCTWEEIFKEEALLSENGISEFDKEEEWPDDESDDNDYNPDGDDSDCRSKSCSSEGSDSNEESGSSSSCCSLESEVFSESEFLAERDGITCNLSQSHPDCAPDPDDHEIVNGPRQRSTVDYRKLYDEMFGKEATPGDLLSEDEDWGPPRKRRREKESDAATTLMTLCETEVKQSCVVAEVEAEKDHCIPNAKPRKTLSRIPTDAVEKLRRSFAENELPSRDDKRRISDLLGLDYEKVDKWFKNARYMALKNRKARRDAHGSASDKSDSEADKTPEINSSKGPTLPVSTCAEKPSDKSDSEPDKTSEINASKDPTLPISTCTKNRLKKVTWNSNLTTLFSPSKQQRLKKTALSDAKAKLELSDDMSLKKHLLRLKAKMRKKRRVIRPNNNQQQSADAQIEQLFRLEAKLQKLKRILSTIQQPKTDEPNGPHSSKYVVYVPVAELKEKS